jgi:hypothetical protein
MLRLAGPGALDARGVAQLHLLLTDGSSPLLRHPHVDDLEAALGAARDALEPRP